VGGPGGGAGAGAGAGTRHCSLLLQVDQTQSACTSELRLSMLSATRIVTPRNDERRACLLASLSVPGHAVSPSLYERPKIGIRFGTSQFTSSSRQIIRHDGANVQE